MIDQFIYVSCIVFLFVPAALILILACELYSVLWVATTAVIAEYRIATRWGACKGQWPKIPAAVLKRFWRDLRKGWHSEGFTCTSTDGRRWARFEYPRHVFEAGKLTFHEAGLQSEIPRLPVNFRTSPVPCNRWISRDPKLSASDSGVIS